MAEDNRTPEGRRQILLVGSAALFAALILFLLWYFLVRTSYLPAFTGVDSADAVTITQELDRLKTPYELADDGTTIMVPEDQVDAARVNILGGELPLKGAVGFELFNKSDMGLTEFAQKINYQRALQGELARTIMALDQVENARVHLSLPEAGIFQQDRRPAKASITVATKIGGDIEPAVVHGIQQLVASAVPDLQPSSVAVLNAKGELLSEAPPEATSVAVTPEQQRRADYETDIASTVEDAVRAAGFAIPIRIKVTALRSFAEDEINVGSPAADNKTGPGTATTVPSAGARDWPISVELMVDADPGASVRQKVMETARTAMAYDAAKGDRLEFRVGAFSADLAPTRTNRRSASPEMPAASQGFQASPVRWWLMLLALVLPLLLFTIWRWNKATGQSGQSEKPEAFAERLKALLQDEANGRPSV